MEIQWAVSNKNPVVSTKKPEKPVEKLEKVKKSKIAKRSRVKKNLKVFYDLFKEDKTIKDLSDSE